MTIRHYERKINSNNRTIGIDTAKRYAKLKDRSLSDLIENYLKLLTKGVETEKIALTPTVKMMKGAFRAPADFDYKKDLTDRLAHKYMKK